MDINVNVNVKFEETPALINCFSAFSTALQATVGALAVATTTTHTATEDNAPAKGCRKIQKPQKLFRLLMLLLNLFLLLKMKAYPHQ